MKREPGSACLCVAAKKARLKTIARAALEMTDTCYVWLERSPEGTLVSLTEQVPRGEALESRFHFELERIMSLETLEKQTAPLRAAVVGHAFSPGRRPRAAALPASVLDPETEAEIEKLLAEIEQDDWLEDAGDIAKTWEERFGQAALKECEEKKP